MLQSTPVYASEAPSVLPVLAERLKREHVAIRHLMAAVKRSIRAAPREESLARVQLLRAIGELHQAFLDHLEFEETSIAPVMRAYDAWGPERVARMLLEHEEQRGMMLELVRAGTPGVKPFEDFVTHARAVLSALEVDMRYEERLLARVLEEDAVVTDQEDG